MDVPLGRVLRPGSLDEALRWLAGDAGARPVAGGTDMVVQLRDGRKRVDTLVDISGLGLSGIGERDGVLEIGACTPMDVIASDPRVRAVCPSLAEAAGLVGAWPIRCRATIGGNIANASPAADSVPPLLVAEARAVIAAPGGRRELPLTECFLGPGKSVLAPGELIVAVLVPPWTARRARAVERFVKVGPRREQIIAVISMAARVAVADGAVVHAAFALGATAPTPVRARTLERFLLGKALTEAVRREACEVIQDDIAPIDDVRAPARYRRVAAAVLVDRVLAEVADA